MNINPLSSGLINLLDYDGLSSSSSQGAASDAGGFADILTESFKNVAETDAADKVSALELLTGQADDMSGLLLDSVKAELSLNLALQIRNKVIDAYSEIMRMSL